MLFRLLFLENTFAVDRTDTVYENEQLHIELERNKERKQE